jgi:dTDP-glucose 4,6-dehydratase
MLQIYATTNSFGEGGPKAQIFLEIGPESVANHDPEMGAIVGFLHHIYRVKEKFVRILVTGGCGFIGSHFVRLVLSEYPDCEIVNLDKMTYAASTENLASVQDDARYRFVKGDIADADVVERAMEGCTHVVNFAAESHVDRSIHGAVDFIKTDVLGTYVLLEAADRAGVQRYLQVSTDEVYGSIREGLFVETDPLDPRSPYSASKAGGDLQVLAYSHTHGLPIVITRGSNTYGPNQYPEKLIPLFVTNAMDGEKLPMYGDGRQVRDWIHATDHASGILTALMHGADGEIYNVGGGNERENVWIVDRILEHTGADRGLIATVADRPGHDARYALDSSKLKQLGWQPKIDVEQGLADTVAWYRDNRSWWEPIKSGEFRSFYEQQYADRLAGAASA